jgi:subtilisin family serine protease
MSEPNNSKMDAGSAPVESAQESLRPAWSSQFAADALRELSAGGPIGDISRDWAWGTSTGKGVRVAIIDSGVEADHPAVGDQIVGGVAVEYDPAAENYTKIQEEYPPQDLFGHGTACAGIIHALAPEAELYSVRVISRDLRGKAVQFAGGLQWAIQEGMDIINMSLSTSSQNFYALFHRLTDEAYFKNILLVSAVNNIPAPSYPSLYSSVVSVAAHEEQDPFTYYYNPSPPVEFGAPGIDVKVAWKDKSYSVNTGNSFAAPHIAGLAALIKGKHSNLTPFQVKTILYACASNMDRGE